MKAVIKKVLQMEGVPSQRLKDLERHSLTEKNGAHAFSREVNGCLENGSQTSGEERRVEIAEKKKSPKPVSKLCMPRRSKSDGETKSLPNRNLRKTLKKQNQVILSVKKKKTRLSRKHVQLRPPHPRTPWATAGGTSQGTEAGRGQRSPGLGQSLRAKG
ncbi:uncharacterized protein AAG666_006529 isoform 5-T5 [Megaptera novaeangliae]